ncbi:zinc finger CCCH domain-containing protein 18-like [Zingiber officinale]|uniref:Zinc finger CCCH domain-containing protein 18 n=1 Tax=Zingiber officinale TaxID=94328 RepID=A0A8J5C7X1_ZINOF|nr:zinc finger CCCH domain-containing protein 18-like [Zingiber officinale]KAG6474292.1 hypothetical protein ZIOFF_068218 [Zingiber officinale]
MARESGDDEASIERQLELQVEEQKESLAALDEALAADPSNPELLSVHGELLIAIKDAEEGLLNLKRSRLLREADLIFFGQEAGSADVDVKIESLDSREGKSEPLEPETYSLGSKCRFRHMDGRWYNGQIVGLEGAKSARISFLIPTSENMMMCKFFLQQRCRFGSNCRLSHGFVIPVASLKNYIPTSWNQSMVGSSIWAAPVNISGLWQKAELQSWDDELKIAQVVFQHDGSSLNLTSDSVSVSEYAELSDDNEDDDFSSEGYGSSEEEEDTDSGNDYQGLGFLDPTTLQRGVQTEIPVFAKWEHHTRGIASKMMASMGYQEGMGLGASGQGILDPVSVKVLPPKQSLDHAFANDKDKRRLDQGKKRSRGGKRKRERQYAEAVRVAKTKEELGPDVFSFINNQLAGQQDVVDDSANRSKKGTGDGEQSANRQDRRSLVAYDDEVKELRIKIEKLKEMVDRNRKDKAVHEAALRKLNETRRALADVQAAHAAASSAVANKEKEKRWLKF